MAPEPVPPPDPPDAEIVTTAGTTLAAMALVWLTASVSLTTTVSGPAAGRSRASPKRSMPATAPPRPAAPPTIAAATMSPTTFPAPDFFFGAAADAGPPVGTEPDGG